jgi:hypothetical protein
MKKMTLLAVIAIGLALIACPTDSPDTTKTNTVAKPIATPAGGQVADNTAITLTTTTAEAAIHYTQDGTEPTAESALYCDTDKPVITAGKLTLKAIAVKSGMNNSETLTATYSITSTTTPTADAGQDFTHDIYKDGVSLTLKGNAQNGTISWACTPPATAKQLTFSDKTTAQPTVSGFDKLGEYTFTLTVTNGTESKSDTVKVTLVATVPAVVSFVPLTASYPTSTIDFSPSTVLPTNITYKLADNKSHSWELGKDGFNGQITASENYNSSGNVTFTQTFYLNGTKITGASERVVVVYLGNFDGIKFAEGGAFSSDTGLVTLNEITITEGSIPPLVVSFVQLGNFPGATTLNFSPITALPTGVTYIITNNKTSKTYNNVGTVSVDDFVDVNDDITFTQTFYLNGTEITGTGSKRTVKLNVDTFMGITDFSYINDTGSITLSITGIPPVTKTITVTFPGAVLPSNTTGVPTLDLSPSYTADGGWDSNFQQSAINYTLKDDHGNNNITNFANVSASNYTKTDSQGEITIIFTQKFEFNGTVFERSFLAYVANMAGTKKFLEFYYDEVISETSTPYFTLSPVTLTLRKQ